MDEKRFCRFCGAHLREGAKFCTNCGATVTRPPSQHAEPNRLWSDVESLWRRFWATSATKQPYKIIAGAGVLILILMVLVAASPSTSTVTSSSNIHNTPLPTMQAKATVIPNTPKQTPKVTPKPTTTPTPAPARR